MSVAFLCVQFRNLLPSEELLRFARSLWSDLQLRGELDVSGDATLSITHDPSNLESFEAELRVEGSALRGRARDVDAMLAVQGVFAQLGSWRALSPMAEELLVRQNATRAAAASLPDTALDTGPG